MNSKYVTLHKLNVYVGYTKGLPKYVPFRCQLKKDHYYLAFDEKFRFEFKGGRIASEVQELLLKLNLDKVYVYSEEEPHWSVTESEKVQRCHILAHLADQEHLELVSKTLKSKFIDATYTDCAPCWCELPFNNT